MGFTEQLPDRTVSGNGRNVPDKGGEVDPKNVVQLNPRVAYTALRQVISECVKHVISPPRLLAQCCSCGARFPKAAMGGIGVRCRVDRPRF